MKILKGKCLQMIYMQRVAKTAIYDVNASAVQRNKMAARMNQKIFDAMSDIFVQQKPLKFGKIGEIIGHFLPNIKLMVKQNKNKSVLAQMDWILPSKSKLVEGFKLDLPAKKNSKRVASAKIPTVLHEIRHLLDHSFNPKFSARVNRTGYSEKYYGFDGRVDTYDNFYKKYLYDDERTAVQKDNFEKNPVLAKKNRLARLEQGIKDLFASPRISSNEKIDIMQSWRQSLTTEKNAYTDGIRFENKIELKKKLMNDPTDAKKLGKETTLKIKKEVDQEVVENRFYDVKIKLIKKLLKEEIANHRRAHAQKLRASLAD